VLGEAKRREELGPFFGPLSAAEVRYLMAHEWGRRPSDVLWRRSKLGLKLSAKETEALTHFMADAAALAPAKREGV
jgi:glycerol-3-phosphate dehydrogenase